MMRPTRGLAALRRWPTLGRRLQSTAAFMDDLFARPAFMQPQDQQDAAHETADFTWETCWPEAQSSLSLSECGTTIRKDDPSVATGALALPVLTEGLHTLTYAVRGDAVVGIATALADPHDWEAKAWGFGTETGCLHHARANREGMPGVILGPQRLLGDACERLVHFQIDLDDSTLRTASATFPVRFSSLEPRLPARLHAC